MDAEAFKPELLEFTAKTLTTCVRETPVRSESLIEDNQRKEYLARVNYIPSVHWMNDPRMIVNEGDVKLVSFNGKWYAPEFHHVPGEVWAAFQELNAERERRLQTPMSAFVNGRKQSRFLFQKSWVQVAQSIQLSISVSSQINSSVTRRKPRVNPPRGYGQIRGGKNVISVQIQTPFLDNESGGGHSPLSTSKYKPFKGRQILASAIAMHRPEFLRKVENKVRRMIYAAKKVR